MYNLEYSFYTDEYLGNVISEKEWQRLERKAYNKVMQLTFNRADMPTSVEVENKVKFAICALAEAIKDVEANESTMRINGGLTSSISSGSESITFADSPLRQSAGNKKLQNKMYYDTVAEYLSGTGMLYAGI